MDNKTRQLLEDCAQQFQYYADIHGAKSTWQGKVKRDANLAWVDRIKEHLNGTA